ncbi:spermidine synthase [Bailinhaonella thermotolerans]|uniref:Spermidine synthase n=1 Tax=Bailinhaonella thermotolerans TaxID=1070861 RepID=A0A3A4AZS8_9ACTN|nr:spermidine synthase [Bailinhaonella thermotolerans]RJL27148.1 spermidine synthase [Bailinhaonella thermotolerans]
MRTNDEPAVLERASGVQGELVLRRAGDDYEIISNGVFLMDTRDGASERLLVSGALDRLPAGAHLLIGGLGVGFSLAEAVRSPALGRATVVECEPAVIGWHAGPLRRFSEGALDDPRVRVVPADLVSWLRSTDERFDGICLDIDNGPDWTVTPGNGALYSPEGLALLTARLTPGGVLAIWSAAPSPDFEKRLRDTFAQVTVADVPVARGLPDVIYFATTAPLYKVDP